MPYPIAAIRGHTFAPPIFTGALDAYESSIVHLYDPARQWLASYTGDLVRLRRDSDDAEADFGPDATGELDVAAIATWLGGSDGYIVTRYDQKGGDDVTQATDAIQPLYVASAQNGHAGGQYDGVGDRLQGAFTNGGALSHPLTLCIVAQLDASVVNDNGLHYLSDGDTLSDRITLGQHSTPTPDVFAFSAPSFWITILNPSNSDWLIWRVLGNGASSEGWINGVSGGSGNAGSKGLTGITIGSYPTGFSFWKGFVASCIIFDSELSLADQQTLDSALAAYWGITLA